MESWHPSYIALTIKLEVCLSNCVDRQDSELLQNFPQACHIQTDAELIVLSNDNFP